MSYSEERPTVAKGRRPYFFDDPSIDKLMSIIMEMAAELSVLRERLDVHERLAAEQEWPTADNINGFVFSDHALQLRAEQRSLLLKRVLRVFSDELERMKRDDANASYPQPSDL